MSDAKLNVVLGAKTAEFNKALKSASARFSKFGKQLQRTGRNLTRNLTVPLSLAGGASIKMSLDFQKSMTRIQTLVGKSTEEIEVMSEKVLELSGETAKSPVELADGLYFLESAGLRGANALSTLEAVAKGSASGLGDMESLSVVVASAQNAFGKETISASEALDKFGVMVRTGMFDSQELSQVLGRQLGLASSLGVSFDEVGALISTFTQTTGDATSATNGLSAILMTLAKLEAEPTKQQAEALEKIGMSASDVTAMVGEEGLMGTLTTLQQRFDENGVAMASFFGKSQALKAVLGVLGNQTESYRSNLDALKESHGFVDDAFQQTSEKEAFQMEKALNGIKVASVELGNTLAPVVTFISEKLISLTEFFRSLSDTQKQNIVRFAGLVAILGPAISLMGGMIMRVVALTKFITKYNVAQKLATIAMKAFNIVTKLNPIGLIIGLIAGLVVAFQQLRDKTSDTAVTFTNFFRRVYNGFVDFANNVIDSFNSIGKYVNIEIPPLKKVELAVADIADASDEAGESVDDLGDKLGNIDLSNLLGGDLDLGGGDTGDGSGDDGDDKEREKKEKSALERIRKLKQQFAELTASDENERAKIRLQNQLTNELLAVEETKHSEEEKDLIRQKFAEKFKQLNEKIANQTVSTYDKMVEQIQKTVDGVLNVVSQVTSAVGGLLDAQDQKSQRLFDNEKARREEDYNDWYSGELKKIEDTIMNEEAKENAIANLDEIAQTRKEEMNDQLDEKEKALRMKQARRDKASALIGAIVNTAQAVTKALTLGVPLGPIMASVVGGLGIAQISAIRSTPLPKLAEGGLAFGPTIAMVGDNPGANVNPEVIAPLSDLKSMIGGGNQERELFSKLRGNDIFLTTDLALLNRTRFT